MRPIDRRRARHATGLVLLAGMFACGGKAGSGSADADAVSAAPRAGPSRDIADVSVSEQRVANVLDANCGLCHGARAAGVGSGGINFIDDISRLVDARLILPLNSAGSRIIFVMQSGSMPPAGSGLPLVSDLEIDTVADFIDDPRFWREFRPSAVDAGVGAPSADARVDGG